MAHPTDAALVRRSIVEIVRGPFARGFVGAYFDPSRGFAGAMFDGLEPGSPLTDNPSGAFTADDIAAASLLDVRFGPTAVRELFSSSTIRVALAAVPDQVPLWKATEEELNAAATLWTLVRDIAGLGRTRTSKLLARKRPQMIPVVDSVIDDALHLGDETWDPLRKSLADPDLRRDIDGLRPQHVSKDISTLRILDAAIWMSHSRSRAAVNVQLELGAPATRDISRARTTKR